MSRRATYVANRRETHDVLLLDAGGAPGGNSEYQQTRFETILRGESAMGLHAHNLGEREIALGAARIRELAGKTGVRFISANARDSEGRLVATESEIIQMAGLRVAVVGIVSPRYAAAGIKIDEPQPVILKWIDSNKGHYDTLVVLAYLPEAELTSLTQALPEADMVVGGPTGQSIVPKKVGPVWMALLRAKGRFLVELLVEIAGVSDRSSVVEVVSSLNEDSTQLENISRYQNELIERDFNAAQSGFVTALNSSLESGEVAGSESCTSCHANDSVIWAGSKHAHAWETLQTRNFHADSYCQQCHTTGFGLTGGFVSAKQSNDRVNVGCESCHGPSLAHVREPKTKTPWLAKDRCVRCHDHENSPKFVLAEYWSRIRHGTVAGHADLPARAGVP
ncbi:MAG: hypothetical protein IPK83_18450 [Planctomycetes bacterium]|nr:hypothetical protein [Planctomycetota bacterium]